MATHWKWNAVCLALPMLLAGPAQAIGLWQAYEAALQHDPTYQSARYESEAGKEYKALGRANLLPTLSASLSQSKNRADYTIHSERGGDSTSHPQYTSRSNSLSLRQPLLNMEGWARYRQGQAQTELSDAQFISRQHELMLRVLSAYLDILFAQDQVALMVAQRDTFAEHRKMNEKMFSKGEGTRTEMLETQAKLDVAEAQLIEARDNLANNKAVLSGIVGSNVQAVDELGKDFRLRPLQPNTFDAWRDLALSNNPELKAQEKAVEIAYQEIRRNKAGHLPRLDLVASLSKNQSETLSTSNQDSTVRSIGVQLNIPLYSGGYVNASSNQAVANHQKAKADLNVRSDRVMQEIRKQFNLATSSAGKIEAVQKAVESSRLLIQATQQSIKGGLRINLDLLNARQQYYSNLRDLAQAKYNYLQAWTRLRAAAGVLSAEDMRAISAYFSEKR
ncbi:TolC family outer membrane protein [Massilia sp. W12]|uniref:TolC family outer membrane protein n=1 Tax=Massilia sp. W12 TaxID=3126507 RepID=UPI0030D4362D